MKTCGTSSSFASVFMFCIGITGSLLNADLCIHGLARGTYIAALLKRIFMTPTLKLTGHIGFGLFGHPFVKNREC